MQIACADGFIAELEQGIDTLLGERGLGLSEGQMQRLAIARAIYSDRPVLLLDEATSALDAGTEEAVLENLRSMTDKTVIIVTHRPAALKLCDRQIVFGEKKDQRPCPGGYSFAASRKTFWLASGMRPSPSGPTLSR